MRSPACKTSAMLAALGLVWSGACQAVTPASPQQILCQGSTAFVGTVMDARSHDCRLQSGGPYCSNLAIVGVTLRVDEVLTPARDALTIGEIVRARVRARNGPPMMFGSTYQMNDSINGAIGFPATGKAVTTAEAKRQLAAKQFIFSVSRDVHSEPGLSEPFFAQAWSGNEQAWVRRQWPSPDCRRWSRH